jgi:hypothetical protein
VAARVQGVGNSGGATAVSTLSATLSATTAGNLLVIAVASRSGVAITTPTITDSSSGTNVWALAKEATGSTNVADIFYSKSTASVTSITATFSATVSLTVFAWEFSGIALSPLDQTAGASATSTAPNSGATATTAQAVEVAVGLMQANGSSAITAVTGLTAETAQSALVTAENEVSQAGYSILSATGTPSFSGTVTSTHWNAVIATFLGSVTPPPVTRRLTRQAVMRAVTY